MAISDNQPYSYVNDNGVTIFVWFDSRGLRHENAAGMIFMPIAVEVDEPCPHCERTVGHVRGCPGLLERKTDDLGH